MDETLQELENELQRLTPRRPSTAFIRATAHAIAEPVPRYTSATSLRSWKWASWPLAGVAAAVALTLALRPARRPAAAPVSSAESAAVATATEPAAPVARTANRYEPVQATSVLYDLQEGQPTTLPDLSEGRAVRYRYVDTYTWKNPSTNASLRWSVPRDEVRLIRTNLD